MLRNLQIARGLLHHTAKDPSLASVGARFWRLNCPFIKRLAWFPGRGTVSGAPLVVRFPDRRLGPAPVSRVRFIRELAGQRKFPAGRVFNLHKIYAFRDQGVRKELKHLP